MPERDELRAEVEALRQQLDEARAENERLRARIHEAVDETNRRYASLRSQNDRLQNLMREASRLHGDEMVKQGRPRWAGISEYDRAALAMVIGARDAVEADNARLLVVYRAADELAGFLEKCAGVLPHGTLAALYKLDAALRSAAPAELLASRVKG